ncbi:N-acetylglucosaminyl-diphospho-decaprenol L-rhamnosyltransferase [Planctomycetes bacterium Pla163]|jgi:GT2 family glycosyltransferase|uniref:N-acetylglucosaminyl-diphospho-decaprenol L-rhamnosyltransferase n=1 Tax=Rohdeia mirabilis TaxID=2528008 RepID=A0A518CZT9_9BACT|nr:N-acetylglucosaminyl-diphospho-decaprenol L-rhamnosyltransferase [Planctomycetes bacterium Pla163]
MLHIDGIWVVIVNFDGGAGNLRSIASVLDEGVDPQHVVFVDNASSDGSTELVDERWPDLVRVTNTQNLGFGAAANQGMELALGAGAQAVFLLNNDAWLEPGCLERLVACLVEEPEVAICGPLVLAGTQGTTVWAAGGAMTWRQNLSTLVGHGRPATALHRSNRDVDYVPGCALLVRADDLRRTGLLDADLFAYHEDVDLCLRVAARGRRVRLIGSAVVRHEAHGATGGGYNPRRKYMMGVNAIWFLRRYGTPVRWVGFVLFDVVPIPLLVLVGSFDGRWRGALAKALGHWHGLRGRRVTAAYLRAGASPLW